MDILNRIKKLFASELKEVEIAEGLVIKYDVLEVGGLVLQVIENEDGSISEVELQDGEYVVEDVVITVKDGIIANVELDESDEGETEEAETDEAETDEVELQEEGSVLSLQEEVDLRLTELERRITEFSDSLNGLVNGLQEVDLGRMKEMLSDLNKDVEDIKKNPVTLSVTQRGKTEFSGEDSELSREDKLRLFYKNRK